MDKKGKAGNGKKEWLITLFIGFVIATAVSLSRGFSFSADTELSFRSLSDGCFISAFVLMGVGILVWISTTGFFDIFGYAMHSLLVLFTSLRNPSSHESYIDYKAQKNEKRGKAQPYILIVGLIFLVLSGLFLLFWHMAQG